MSLFLAEHVHRAPTVGLAQRLPTRYATRRALNYWHYDIQMPPPRMPLVAVIATTIRVFAEYRISREEGCLYITFIKRDFHAALFRRRIRSTRFINELTIITSPATAMTPRFDEFFNKISPAGAPLTSQQRCCSSPRLTPFFGRAFSMRYYDEMPSGFA